MRPQQHTNRDSYEEDEREAGGAEIQRRRPRSRKKFWLIAGLCGLPVMALLAWSYNSLSVTKPPAEAFTRLGINP